MSLCPRSRGSSGTCPRGCSGAPSGSRAFVAWLVSISSHWTCCPGIPGPAGGQVRAGNKQLICGTFVHVCQRDAETGIRISRVRGGAGMMYQGCFTGTGRCEGPGIPSDPTALPCPPPPPLPPPAPSGRRDRDTAGAAPCPGKASPGRRDAVSGGTGRGGQRCVCV